MSQLGFFYSLYKTGTGKRLITQSVSGKSVGAVLEHVAKIIGDYRAKLGENAVTVIVQQVRLDESVITDAEKLESVSTLVTLAADHYCQKAEKVVVETNVPKKFQIIENLTKILASPQKRKKLMELDLPSLEKGDVLLVGKWKNRKATIKGFKKDENNQPVAVTDKGEQKIFKPRVEKLMPESEGPSCPHCGAGAEHLSVHPYDFGRSSETGYHDAGERFKCHKCGGDGDADDVR